MQIFMRKYLTLALTGLLLAVMLVLPGISDAAKRTVHVNNIYDMMEALGDDTEIVLAPGRYNISEWQKGNAAGKMVNKFEYNKFSPAGLYQGYQMSMAGYRNLTIRGRDIAAITAEIVIEEPYDSVLAFQNCTNLTIANVSVGHIVEKGTCSGAVLEFTECKNVDIYNSDLYGCGTYGYEARNCDTINVYDSVIRECTYGLISAYDCTNLRFLRTTFKDTRTSLSLMWLQRSQISLEDCAFANVFGPIDGLQVSKGVNTSNASW